MPAVVDPGLLRLRPKRKLATAVYVGRGDSSGGSFGNYTFPAIPRGVVGPTRKLVTAFNYGNSNGIFISSVTHEGGIAATLVAGSRTPDGPIHSEIWVADVPLLTAGNVAVVFSGSQLRINMAQWASYDAGAPSGFADGVWHSPLGVTIPSVPANGCVVAIASNDSGSGNVTWTNLDEDFDTAVYGSTPYHSGAHRTFEAAQANLAISAALSSSPDNPKFTAAVFGPAA